MDEKFASSLTHLNYAFAMVDPESGEVKIPQAQHDNLKHLFELKKKFRPLKTLISIGGDADSAPFVFNNSMAFVNGVSTNDKVARFIDSATKIVEDHKFDGRHKFLPQVQD